MSVIAIREQHEPAIPQAAMGLVEWAQEADAAYRLAQKLVGTSFSPQAFRGKPEEAAAAMLAGAEVGLSPMASLSAFDVIQGRAAPRAITLRAIAQSHGCEMVVTEATPSRVTMEGRRRGDERWTTVTWTLDRARDLGLLTKDQWKKQPQTMLIARATSELARLIAADAILGIGYSIEELADDVPEPTAKVSRSTSRVQRANKPQPPEPEFDEPEAAPDGPAQEPVKAAAERADSDGPEPITPKQLTALNAMLTSDYDLTNRDDKLAFLSAELQTNVRQLARLGGFITYHTNDSRRSDKGFPDLVMVHPLTGRVVYAELKSEKGRIRPEQQTWIDALARGGHTVHVWRPDDWHSGAIGDVLLAERAA